MDFIWPIIWYVGMGNYARDLRRSKTSILFYWKGQICNKKECFLTLTTNTSDKIDHLDGNNV